MQIVIVNFKTYPNATGEHAVTLAKQCEAAGKKYGVDMRIAVQATDLWRVAQAVDIPVYAQHTDPIKPQRHTGFLSAHAIKEAKGKGALLNHSEHPMFPEDIIEAVKLLAQEKLDTIVLVPDIKTLQALDARISPTLFGIEPPELVAGEVSVSSAQPDLVKQAVHATRKPLIVGAGVKTHEDLSIAKELHAAGVILSSGITLAPHRDAAFRKLFTPHVR